jgi:tRNA1(Val) A37 N6-methylase TrmN6
VRDRLRLLCLSFLLLFVELALIRWAGSNVVYLSYFSNFVLLGSFLGIGIGFMHARHGARLFPWAPVALALLVAFVHHFHVEIDRSGGQLIYFGSFEPTGLPIWLTLPIVFICVAAVMALIAAEAARVFGRFPPLDAYRIDIAGSILGICAFSLLSFLGWPPLAWGVVVASLFGLLLPRRLVVLPALCALLVMVAALERESQPAWSDPVSTSWSPYYKIQVTRHADHDTVSVNGVPHQVISSVAYRRRTEPIYFAPYTRRSGSPGDVLIVGAGTGTDVAIALAQGARHVDAVEIDPRLHELGVELQPDHAFQDPRVTTHITDGRAYLERTRKKFDLILFALPDSLTLVSGQSSLRLESYLFTLEAIRAARSHLKSGGVFAMYNYYRTQWLVDRLAGTLRQVYGTPPCIDVVHGSNHFAALADGNASCATTWSAGGRSVPAPARDDRPFLYLRTRSIPPLYLLTLAMILVAAIVAVGVSARPIQQMGGYLDLFFMGAAFLLLETKNVVQFALLFGTTWLVNALVFGGILVVVLAAVEAARRLPLRRPGLLYGALFLSLAVAWAVPPDDLLGLSWGTRLVAAIGLAFAPVFCANLLFAERFKTAGQSTVAFGANLLGAMVGGILEYGALIVGYRALLIVVAALYVCAIALGRSWLAAGAAEGAPAETYAVGMSD